MSRISLHLLTHASTYFQVLAQAGEANSESAELAQYSHQRASSSAASNNASSYARGSMTAEHRASLVRRQMSRISVNLKYENKFGDIVLCM